MYRPFLAFGLVARDMDHAEPPVGNRVPWRADPGEIWFTEKLEPALTKGQMSGSFISISVVRPLEIVAAIAEPKECSQLICSALNVALSIRPLTGILSTDWNQRIALSVSGPRELFSFGTLTCPHSVTDRLPFSSNLRNLRNLRFQIRNLPLRAMRRLIRKQLCDTRCVRLANAAFCDESGHKARRRHIKTVVFCRSPERQGCHFSNLTIRQPA